MIADPLAKVIGWDVGVIANRPKVLDGKADGLRPVSNAPPLPAWVRE